MKTVNQLFFLSFFTLFLFSCSSDDGEGGNNLQGIEAQFCNNFQGSAAAYWNMANGVFVPLPDFPIIANPGGQVTHPLQPLLSLTYPQGYRGFTITDQQTATIGLDILRNDDAVFFRWIPNTTLFGTTNFDAIIAREINTMFAVYGFNGEFDVICTRNTSQEFESLVVNFNARLIRFEGITGFVWVRSVFVPATGSVNSAIQISAAPTAEFDGRALDTFLPFNFQLHVRPDGGGFILTCPN